MREPPSYFAFHPDRIAADGAVEAMSTLGFGAYTLLVCKAWKQHPPATLPKDDEILSRWARVSEIQWTQIRKEVTAAFSDRGDRWRIEWLHAEYRRVAGLLKAQALGGAEGAKRRWDRHKGTYGSPNGSLLPTEQTEQNSSSRTENTCLNPAAVASHASGNGSAAAVGSNGDQAIRRRQLSPEFMGVYEALRKVWPGEEATVRELASHPNATPERVMWLIQSAAAKVKSGKMRRGFEGIGGHVRRGIERGWNPPGAKGPADA